MNTRRCYISKSFSNVSSGGNKAKTDVEKIMDSLDFVNLGVQRSIINNPIKRFSLTLYSVIKASFLMKKGDIIVLQYPFKKYYTFLCKVAHLKGAKIVTLIHDLGCFRRKKLSLQKEKRRLGNSDYLIALNQSMKAFLVNSGYTQPIGTLEIWDYLSSTQPIPNREYKQVPEIVYAGNLTTKENSFLYKLEKTNLSKAFTCTVYGSKFETNNISNNSFYTNKGFVKSDDLIKETTGSYGLIWYGHSLSDIDGTNTGYINITSVHKLSLYIRCHLPLIAWSESAQADLIKRENIGICVADLEQLDVALSKVTPEAYEQMRQNTIKLSQKLENGHYFKKAFLEAERVLTN